MSNILLAYNNRATGATFAGGSYTAGLPRSNLGTSDIDEVARTSSAAQANTRFRFDIAASRTLRALNLTNHNLSTAALVRLRAGRAVFDVDWASYIAEDRATFSGGAGGTRVTSAGLVAAATTPRINHNPISLAVLGLLIEEQRSNLLLRSSELGTTWTLGGSTPASLSANVTLAPDGSVSADRITGTTSASDRVQQTVSVSASTTYALSHYVQNNSASTRSKTHISFPNSVVTNSEMYPNWSGAAITSITQIGATVGSYQLEGASFYRVTLRATSNASDAGTATVRMYPAADQGATVKHLDFWGAMLEAATTDYPYATSYIPTTSAQVTRTADSITVTSSSFTGIHSATAGTIYAEFNLNAASGTRPIVSLDDGTANERIEMYVSGTSLKFKVVDGGVTQCDITIGTVAAETFYKAAVAWQANDFTGCLSGTLAASPDTSGTLPTVDRMRIGSDQAGNFQNGHQKRTARFLERLTNAELQLITTSGIDALGYDSGWVNALRFAFIGDTPTAWGEQYPVMFAFDAITARYGTLEINDTANTAGYVQAGRLFVGGGFQPTNNAEYGRQRGRNDLSSSVTSISGKKFSTARRRPRTVDMRFPVLSIAEANHLDEMADAVGTTEEVFYVPDPADMELSQRQGFLAHMRELGALEDSFYENVATPYRLEEKL